MALTTSSRFESIEIDCSLLSEDIFTIYYEVYNEDAKERCRFKVIEGSLKFSSSTHETEFGTLQSIYASDDGFLTNLGSSISVTVSNFSFGNSLDDLADHYFNPFDEDEVTRWVKGNKYLGKFHLDDDSVSFDSTTDEATAVIQGNLSTDLILPDTTTINYPLTEWEVITREGDRVSFVLDSLKPYGLSLSDLDNFAPCRAFVNFMNNNRSTTTDEADYDMDESNKFDGTYSFDLTSSIELVIENLSSNAFDSTVDSDDIVESIEYNFEKHSDSDSGAKTENLRDHVRSQTVSMTISSGRKSIRSQLGSKIQKLQVLEIENPDGDANYRFKDDYLNKSSDKGSYVIGPQSGLSATLDDLDTVVIDSTTRYLLPPPPDFQTLDLSGQSSAVRLRFDRPLWSNYLYDNNDRIFLIDNIDGSRDHTIYDWEGNEFFKVYQDEVITCRATRKLNGKGLVQILNPPSRTLSSEFGTEDFSDMLSITSSGTVDYILPFNGTVDDTGVEYHDDVFELGDAYGISGYNYDYGEDDIPWDYTAGFKFKKEGSVEIYINGSIETSSSSINVGNYVLQLIKENAINTDTYDVERSAIYPGNTSGNAGNTFSTSWILTPDVDTWYLVTILLTNFSASNESNLTLPKTSMDIKFDNDVSLSDDGSYDNLLTFDRFP